MFIGTTSQSEDVNGAEDEEKVMSYNLNIYYLW